MARPGKSWNSLRGCRPKSPGCKLCYAATQAARWSGPGQPYEGLAQRTRHGGRWTGAVRYLPEKIPEPLRWPAGTRVFINSMSDLAQPGVQPAWIDAMIEVIRATPAVSYVGLTKWPERLPALLYQETSEAPTRALKPWETLPNLILGTSIESQPYAPRAQALLDAWGGPTVVSAEPLLGPLDLSGVLWQPCRDCQGVGHVGRDGDACVCARYSPLLGYERLNRLSWVIVGGESGHGARPARWRSATWRGNAARPRWPVS